jgi:hypothetical protein
MKFTNLKNRIMITEQENRIRNAFFEEKGMKAYKGHINDGDKVIWNEEYVKWLESKLNQHDINDSDIVVLYLKNNDGLSSYVGVYESVDKFIELIKSNYTLDTFKFLKKNGELLIERYFRDKELISRTAYLYKPLELNGNFSYFK